MKKTLNKIFAATCLIMSGIIMTSCTGVSANTTEPQKEKISPTNISQNAKTSAEAVSNNIYLYIGSKTALVNDKSVALDVAPFIRSNRTYVPLRFISENMNATVAWDQKTMSATITSGDTILIFTKDSEIMKANGKDEAIDAAPIMLDNRMFIPLTYAAEAFGLTSEYNKGLIALSNDGAERLSDKTTVAALINTLSGLPIVGTAENFNDIFADKIALAKKNQNDGGMNLYATSDMAVAELEVSESQSATGRANSPSKESGEADYSQTNTQVQGVDEADIIKTDGEYIYHVTNQQVEIVRAYPGSEMNNVSTIFFEKSKDEYFNPTELYVDGNKLAIIGYSYVYENTTAANNSTSSSKAIDSIMPYSIGSSYSMMLVYDITDKENPTFERKVSIEGSYVSTRKIGDIIYIINNQYVNYYSTGGILPRYLDSAVDNRLRELDCTGMIYFPDSDSDNVLIIAGVDLSNPDSEASISSILGSGHQVFMSENALYVAKYSYSYRLLARSGSSNVNTDTTSIYKFALSDGTAIYTSTGEVPGSVLNQFSMDEHDNYIRVATTSRNDNWESKNNLYVLDYNMQICGKVENLAPGETVYSARFLGDRAFMVTYRTVDPLFTIDLSSPTNPVVLGELKIPGYSSYLHPYDENHLIGFGMDTEELKTYDSRGNLVSTSAIQKGLKMSMFDVTDMTNPIEMFSEAIGGRGSYSELLYNHKAILFSKDKGLLAFPASLNTEMDNVTDYGNLEFIGALVYDVDLENGFTLKSKITHHANADLKNYNYDYKNTINRLMYISDTLYSVATGGIQATDLNTMQLLGSVSYNLKEANNYTTYDYAE